MAKTLELKAMNVASAGVNVSGNDADHGRYAVDGEDHVAALDHQQHQEHRGDAEQTVFPDEETTAVPTMVVVGDRQ